MMISSQQKERNDERIRLTSLMLGLDDVDSASDDNEVVLIEFGVAHRIDCKKAKNWSLNMRDRKRCTK